KPDFKNSEKSPAFKKKPVAAHKSDTSSRAGEGRHTVESKDITREVLERFPSLSAPNANAAPSRSTQEGAVKPARTKPKSKRVDKDKGKRRKPSANSPQE
ncbi:MAG: hypothetical protein ACRER5_13490, partial [Pseudomonas sp.]